MSRPCGTRCRTAYGALGFLLEYRLIDYRALTTAFQSADSDDRLILLNVAWAMATGTDYRPPDEKSALGGWPRLIRTRECLLHTELASALRTDRQGGTPSSPGTPGPNWPSALPNPSRAHQ